MGKVIDEKFCHFFSDKITILMAAFNAENFLKETLDSIFAQSFSDFNLLVVEDGSFDKTLELLKEYKEDRLYILPNEENIRLVASLNRGLKIIQSEYIFRMDADDLIHQDRLKIQYEFMVENQDVDICGSYIKNFGDLNNTIKMPLSDKEIKASIPFHSIMAHATVVFRTAHLRKHNYDYREKHMFMEDIDLWSRIFKFTKFANIPRELYYYRWEGQNITGANMVSRQEREEKFFEELYSRLGIKCSSEEITSFLKKRNTKKVEKLDIKNTLNLFRKILSWNLKTKTLSHPELVMKVKIEREQLFFKACDSKLGAALVFVRYPSIVLKNFRYFVSKAIINR